MILTPTEHASSAETGGFVIYPPCFKLNASINLDTHFQSINFATENKTKTTKQHEHNTSQQ